MKQDGKVCAKVTTMDIDILEFYISRAELFYGDGKTEPALKEARKALTVAKNYRKEKEVSIRIFIAKCLSNLGQIEESNKEYRGLIDEEIFLPPIILGLLHNNLMAGNDEKVKNNMYLMKLFVGKDEDS